MSLVFEVVILLFFTIENWFKHKFQTNQLNLKYLVLFKLLHFFTFVLSSFIHFTWLQVHICQYLDEKGQLGRLSAKPQALVVYPTALTSMRPPP